jgi:hypothetical protein
MVRSRAACRRHDPFLADLEGDLAVEDVETLFLPAVNVRRRPAARRHDGLKHCVFAVRVVAGRQEAINITDDSDSAAFRGRSQSRLVGHTLSPRFARPRFLGILAGC